MACAERDVLGFTGLKDMKGKEALFRTVPRTCLGLRTTASRFPASVVIEHERNQALVHKGQAILGPIVAVTNNAVPIIRIAATSSSWAALLIEQ